MKYVALCLSDNFDMGIEGATSLEQALVDPGTLDDLTSLHLSRESDYQYTTVEY